MINSLSHLYTIIFVIYVGVIFGGVSDACVLISSLFNKPKQMSNNTVSAPKNTKKQVKINQKAHFWFKKAKNAFVLSSKVIFSSMLDILICVIGFGLFALSLHRCNYGEFRFYFVILFFVGFALEKVSVGFFVAKVNKKRYNDTRR